MRRDGTPAPGNLVREPHAMVLPHASVTLAPGPVPICTLLTHDTIPLVSSRKLWYDKEDFLGWLPRTATSQPSWLTFGIIAKVLKVSRRVDILSAMKAIGVSRR